MRIVFMGTPRFAVPSLAALLEARYDLPAVVTVADTPRGRGQHIGMSAVKEFALSRSMPVLQPDRLDDPAFVARLRELQPDLFVVVAFRILPQEVYTIPSRGAFNLHASLLPKYRGAAPINWAIMNGERETGVTTFFLEQKVDTGSMILQKRTHIASDETAGELADRLASLGAEAVIETVKQVAAGTVRTVSQDDTAASVAPKIRKDDCIIPWSKTADVVHNFVRGLAPVPCAWTTFRGRTVRIYRTSVSGQPPAGTAQGAMPGEIVYVDKDLLLVETGGRGLISVIEIQQEGKKRMGIAEFLRGFRLKAGDRFGA
jgi:methionyl-tRNA formyltransferase